MLFEIHYNYNWHESKINVSTTTNPSEKLKLLHFYKNTKTKCSQKHNIKRFNKKFQALELKIVLP